jgi:hypothetical protein
VIHLLSGSEKGVDMPQARRFLMLALSLFLISCTEPSTSGKLASEGNECSPKPKENDGTSSEWDVYPEDVSWERLLYVRESIRSFYRRHGFYPTDWNKSISERDSIWRFKNIVVIKKSDVDIVLKVNGESTVIKYRDNKLRVMPAALTERPYLSEAPKGRELSGFFSAIIKYGGVDSLLLVTKNNLGFQNSALFVSEDSDWIFGEYEEKTRSVKYRPGYKKKIIEKKMPVIINIERLWNNMKMNVKINWDFLREREPYCPDIQWIPQAWKSRGYRNPRSKIHGYLKEEITLAGWQRTAELKQDIAQYINNEHEEIRALCVWAIGRIKAKEFSEKIWAMRKKEASDIVILDCIRALKALDENLTDVEYRFVRDSIKNPKEMVKIHAIECFAQIESESEDAVFILETALKVEKDIDVKLAILLALERIYQHDKSALEIIAEELLFKEYEPVRTAYVILKRLTGHDPELDLGVPGRTEWENRTRLHEEWKKWLKDHR